MKRTVRSAAVIIALIAMSFTVNKSETKKYNLTLDVPTWNGYLSTIDSATKYLGLKSISYEDAVTLKQNLQEMKNEILKQVGSQYIADSNYYKHIQDSINKKK